MVLVEIGAKGLTKQNRSLSNSTTSSLLSLNTKASGGGSIHSSCFSGSGSSCFYSGKSIAVEVVIFRNRSSCSSCGSFSSSSSSTVVVVKVVVGVLVAGKRASCACKSSSSDCIQ